MTIKKIDTKKKDINNFNEIQQTFIPHVSYRKVYGPTKVKARNSCNSYKRVKDVDLTNDSFIIDCYTFILFYLNPFYLERKFKKCNWQRKSWSVMALFYADFYVFICKSEHFTTLNKIFLKYQTGYEIISKFVDEGGLAQLK